MFNTWKIRLALGIYVFLVLFIPVGSYLVSQQQTIKSRASEEISSKIEGTLNPTSQPTTTESQKDIKKLLSSASATPRPTPSSTPTTAISFGPTLSFKLILEGRPATNQASQVFVGISAGITTGVQKAYLLSFTIDLPGSGEYSNLSLAGLDVNSQYTAFIKPTAQIATSSAFLMSPSVTTLNASQALKLLTGDLNQDNIIDNKDYQLALQAFGSHTGDTNWNEVADFNKDGVVNNYDLSFITKNLNKTGSSGPWQSTPTSSSNPPGSAIGGASSSAEEHFPQAITQPDGSKGYWLWVPQ